MTALHRVSLATFIVAATLYGLTEWRQADNNTPTSEEDFRPAYIAELLNTALYDGKGKLYHQIKARRMDHFKELEFTHFEFPEYTIYPSDNSSPWRITSDEAVLYQGNKAILENRVTMLATDPDSFVQEIHCKYLELDLNTNIISTDQTILIKGKDFTLYGSGIILDLNSADLKINQHVQTIYHPKNS